MLDFSWQSFAFALANFLILAWLLYRLLHKPLLRVLRTRRETIEKSQAAARAEHEKAEEIRKEYEAKLAAAADERDSLLTEARTRTDEARVKVLEKATEQARQEVARLKEAWERESREAVSGLQQEIADLSIETARRILAQVADTGVEARLHQQLIAELDALIAKADEGPDSRGDRDLPVRLLTARELDTATREDLVERIRKLAGEKTSVEVAVDESLVAGGRIEFSTMAIDSNLRAVLDTVREGATAPDEAKPTEEHAGEST